MIKKIRVLAETLKYLTPKQLFFRVFYSVRKRIRGVKGVMPDSPVVYELSFQESITAHSSFEGKQTFMFLNQRHAFNPEIDWNFNKYGMLWTYNLNYFEFLLQKDMDKETGLSLIRDYIAKRNNIKVGYDPYPISLRNLFWIRFCILHEIKDPEINAFILSSYNHLEKNIEYHLLGNHLLENAFSMLFGAYYFQSERFYRKAKKILKKELNEQILKDGAHFELSPMYHQIMLYRLLDCINLVSNNLWKQDELHSLMRDKAKQMLGWLKQMSFKDGRIPLLNDAANNIAPATNALLSYGERLDLHPLILPLNESGYRKFESPVYECIMDVGRIGPDYQPGHAHADTFNVVLTIKGEPVIVDTGCSTYEPGEIRSEERGTAAHNTVVLDGKNTSDVWASHRVGKRAKVVVQDDTPGYLRALHDGYRKEKVLTIRSIEQKGENFIIISDLLEGRDNLNAIAYFHLDRNVEVLSVHDNIVSINGTELSFVGANKIELKDYLQAEEFNLRFPSRRIEVSFVNKLTTTIYIK